MDRMSLPLQIVFMVTSMDRELLCNENMNTGGVTGAMVGGFALASLQPRLQEETTTHFVVPSAPQPRPAVEG